MNIKEFLKLMEYPPEWNDWNMFPHELFKIQCANYEVGDEVSSEHYRTGAFFWWIESPPSEEQLNKLIKLAYLDPDPQMGKYVREELEKLKHVSWVEVRNPT